MAKRPPTKPKRKRGHPPNGEVEHRCTARNNSGARCQRGAIAGGSVCIYHGGSAPQVKAAAQRRFAALVDPAIGALEDALKKNQDPGVRIKAARDVLDRAGLKPADTFQDITDYNGELADWTDEELEQLRMLYDRRRARMGEDVPPTSVKVGP